MKKYRAERRQKNGSPKPGPDRPKIPAKRKGISAVGRAAIAASEKKSWAKLRREGKARVKAVKTSGEDRQKWAVPNAKVPLAQTFLIRRVDEL